jgi:hypothetical protein
MIWLAAYPRSGSTFFRIVLYEAYGIASSELYDRRNQGRMDDDPAHSVVKTHLLPHQIVPADPAVPAVYLVRDGRDALVSMARYRSDLLSPGSSFAWNLFTAVVARPGSYFGGWSRHVRLWTRRAGVVVRFEDLVVDPIASIERIRSIFPELPTPRAERVPDFAELRSREHGFGPGSEVLRSPEFRERFFRKGRVGGWADEMPRPLLWLFYLRHGKMLRRMGYAGGA